MVQSLVVKSPVVKGAVVKGAVVRGLLVVRRVVMGHAGMGSAEMGGAESGSFRRRVGVLLVALVLSAGCEFQGVGSLPLPGGPDTGPGAYTVRVEFANVLDLVPNSVVKVHDVTVGRVTRVGLDGWRATVTCLLRRDVVLPANATAAISQTSLLGEKFVALAPPPGMRQQGRLGDGAVIPLASTSRTTEVEEVLSALSLLVNAGGLEQLSTITKELNGALHGREATVRRFLENLEDLVGRVDRQRHVIVRAIDGLDRLSGRLARERTAIAAAVDRTAPAAGILAGQRSRLTKLLTGVDRLSEVAVRVIDRSGESTVANLRALQPILGNLDKAGRQLPEALSMLLTLGLPPTMDRAFRGDYVNVFATVDLHVGGTLNNLLGGRPAGGLSGLLGGGPGR
ncbi:MCE family protein [Actinomadura sp. 9N407]|uniref:MCE family protein n=1 Tax=Actinomadura sp. 9N407 TaxID=3375154 RepID=UPI0037A86B7B